MILLNPDNRIIQETLTLKFLSRENSSPFEVDFFDFDGVKFHLEQGPEPCIELSVSLNGFQELLKYGALEIIDKIYPGIRKSTPKQGYDITLAFDLSSMTDQSAAEFAEKASLLKRHLLSVPFERAFDQQLEAAAKKQHDSNFPLMSIRYRDVEAMHVRAMSDRVTVIFETQFKDASDVILGKVFLQEFVDARRHPSLQNGPQVLFSKEAPLDITGAGITKSASDQHCFITFVLNPRHYSTSAKRDKAISLIQNFRNYLHYHIKCSKAYLHSRMRARVGEWLKVLNRAKPEIINVVGGGAALSGADTRKTASGKTFKRAV